MINADITKQISLSISDTNYAIGGSIPISVTYTNQGNNPISFRDPEKTWEVKLKVINHDAEENQVPFGRIFFYQGNGFERTTIEDADDIPLNPKQSHTFKIDAGNRWTELFSPGLSTLQVIDQSDDNEIIASNTVKLHIVFSDNSFINLLSIIANKNHSEDSRIFALDWIKKIHTGFIFYIHEPTNVEELTNHKMIQDAQNWWQINQRTPDVLEKIAEINSVSSEN